MTKTIGIIAGVLFFVKIIAHIILLSLTEDDFNLFDYGTSTSPKVAMVGLLPFMGDVPKNYRILKTIINVLYTISFVGIIIFLVGENI